MSLGALKKRLWQHQNAAVDAIERYTTAYRSNNSIGHCLISMPTGTGKTGVIAAVAHFLPKIDNCIIAAPRRALKHQLLNEIDGRFFKKVGLATSIARKPASHLEDIHTAVNVTQPTIHITTIQKLLVASKMNRQVFDNLASNTGLLIFDEGHYQPANSWKKVVESFKCPIVLLTATPFRNDLKAFSLAKEHGYYYSFSEAEKRSVVRSVEFLSRSTVANEADFVADVMDAYKSKFRTKLNSNKATARVIIRCENHHSIESIGARLRQNSVSHVLIHEEFMQTPPGSNRYNQVPDPLSTDAIVWVHQYKLLEGIDDPRFQMVAMFGKEFCNTRSVVQQIGRVIRRTNKGNQTAYVLDHFSGNLEKQWKSYRECDLRAKKNGISEFDFISSYINASERFLPEIFYSDGAFRDRFLLNTINPETDLELQRSSIFYSLSSLDTPSLEDIANAIESEYRERDLIVRRISIDPNTTVFVYYRLELSPLLSNKYFLEPQLGVSVIQMVGNSVAFHDSMGQSPCFLSDHGKRFKPIAIQKLFKAVKGDFLTRVDLLNTDISTLAIRSKSIGAGILADTPPGLDDSTQVCSAAVGRVRLPTASIRRYVGFERARVSDYQPRTNLAALLEWQRSIIKQASSRAATASEFSRYASVVNAPSGNMKPVHVLFDVVDAIENYSFDVQGSKEPLKIDDVASSVDENGRFFVKVNNETLEASITFDPERERYLIESSMLRERITAPTTDALPFLTVLNRDQLFRVVPSNHSLLYSHGTFYSPTIKFGPTYDDTKTGVLASLYGVPKLKTCASEKGTQCKPEKRGWETGSIFDLIDSLKSTSRPSQFNAHLSSVDILVCDDLGTESCDFLLSDSTQKVVAFVHAKASSEPGIFGASKLHEVISQAVKNLKYARRIPLQNPEGSSTWHTKEWSNRPKTTGTVKERIRKAPRHLTKGSDLWNEIRARLANPNYRIEVWLVLGQTLSKQGLENQIKLASPDPASIQTVCLISAACSAIGSVGARLKIFCSP